MDTAPPAFATTAVPAPEAVVAAPGLAVPDPDARPIDFLLLKVGFRRLFPSGHPVRSLVEAEPDLVPRREGLAKLEMIVRLVWALRRNRA